MVNVIYRLSLVKGDVIISEVDNFRKCEMIIIIPVLIRDMFIIASMDESVIPTLVRAKGFAWSCKNVTVKRL